jgi:hypothetical protein
MTTSFLSPASTGSAVPFADPLTMAVGAYLGRFMGSSREHTGSDLRVFPTWCGERGVRPLAAHRADLEVYVRWMQETRRFKPSTVSRRISVLAGFYRTCVIDGVLAHSPAEHVRRPTVPVDSPTLGLTHLQFEALLTAARQSAHDCDFALVVMLGLLGTARKYSSCPPLGRRDLEHPTGQALATGVLSPRSASTRRRYSSSSSSPRANRSARICSGVGGSGPVWDCSGGRPR